MSRKLPIPTVNLRVKSSILIPMALTLALLLLLLLATLFPAPARSAAATIPVTAVYRDSYLDDDPNDAFHPMNANASAIGLPIRTVNDGRDEGTDILTSARVLVQDPDDYVLYLPLMLLGHSPPPVPGQPELHIYDLIYYECDERVQINNQGDAAQDLTGWRIQSVVENQWYTFPDGYILAAGSSVFVHSGPDAQISPPIHLLWDYDYKWRNAGDKALLYNADGQIVDTYCYGDSCP